MRIDFQEEFRLPVSEVYSYFETPADWARLYGLAGQVEDRGGGWYAVPLANFPFPLVARNTVQEPERRVKWDFRGFWRGEGEVRFAETSDGGTRVEGYEEVGVRPLMCLSPVVEKLFLERQFRDIWRLGWRRLRTFQPSAES